MLHDKDYVLAKSRAKAKRKQRISHAVYGFDWYNNLHQYSKGKVHCSCGLCKTKKSWRWKSSYGTVQQLRVNTKTAYDLQEEAV